MKDTFYFVANNIIFLVMWFVLRKEGNSNDTYLCSGLYITKKYDDDDDDEQEGDDNDERVIKTMVRVEIQTKMCLCCLFFRFFKRNIFGNGMNREQEGVIECYSTIYYDGCTNSYKQSNGILWLRWRRWKFDCSESSYFYNLDIFGVEKLLEVSS